jgi:integrase
MATRKNPMKGLFKVKAKGRTYYYAFRGGPRIEAQYGSPEFLEEYLAARSPDAHLDRSRFGAWVGLYKASADYRKLADATKRNWAPKLDAIKAHFGKLPIRVFDRPAIRKDIRHWRDKWRAHPRMADIAKQVLSRVCSFAMAEGALSSNPCEGIPNLYDVDRSEIIWTLEDLDALCKVASPEIQWAARLAALTGLRQGDLLRLTWSQVGDLAIQLKTSKSRGRRSALVPITQAIRDQLAAIPRRAMTVLTNTNGESWKTGFGASWQAAIKRADLGGRDLHFHDLRGTAATNYYRAGLTSQEIADIMGWGKEHVEKLIDIYVKRDELLLDRIHRLERFATENRKTDSKTGGAR